jgi:hypothetical protein
MAKDSSGGMDWGGTRAASRVSNEPSYYAPGTTCDRPGLHKNCSGCPHIVEKACKFIKFPKNRKWPCTFRDR